MREREIHLLQTFARLSQGLGAVAGIGQLRAEQLKVEEKVVGRRAPAEGEGIGLRAKLPADIFSREQLAQIVRAVFAEPACSECPAGER